jgi:hypothetical protein
MVGAVDGLMTIVGGARRYTPRMGARRCAHASRTPTPHAWSHGDTPHAWAHSGTPHAWWHGDTPHAWSHGVGAHGRAPLHTMHPLPHIPRHAPPSPTVSPLSPIPPYHASPAAYSTPRAPIPNRVPLSPIPTIPCIPCRISPATRPHPQPCVPTCRPFHAALHYRVASQPKKRLPNRQTKDAQSVK